MEERIKKLWQQIYGDEYQAELSELLLMLKDHKEDIDYLPKNKDWYQKGAVYSLYVDLFADDFEGLITKLDYLDELGVKTIWLLPVLQSPMVDQGFDVSDYYKIREELGGNQEFFDFITAAHQKGMKVVFDIAINHSSSQHPWFKVAKESRDSEYRDYYIWNGNQEKYKEARLLLKGISNSNWTYNKATDDYYFHRFYDIQPDLNYKNPDVLIEMIKIFSFWKQKGIDGFRMDAAPFLWKREGTNCENLLETHLILKLFRAALDFLGEGSIIIAEANQKPEDVIEYFGDGDECHVAYHFPVMPKVFLALGENNPEYLIDELEQTAKLDLPDSAQWFTFLRCHDELTLEFVNEWEREKMLDIYLKEDDWVFRDGEGISGRLYDLLEQDYRKVLLAYSILFSLLGTPIIYYGDEIGMENDREFYEKMIDKTGYCDSRYLNRGAFDEVKKELALNDPQKDEAKIFTGLKAMLELKKEYKGVFLAEPDYKSRKGVFISVRRTEDKKLIIYNNLQNKKINIDGLTLRAYDYNWVIKNR